MVAIKVAADGRLLPAKFPFGDNPEEAIHVESLPEGNVLDYKYINGEFVYEPLPIPEPTPEPSTEERIATLEQENKLLTQQVDALSSQNDFQEELIVELANIVYA